jgi:hypothetical protein
MKTPKNKNKVHKKRSKAVIEPSVTAGSGSSAALKVGVALIVGAGIGVAAVIVFQGGSTSAVETRKNIQESARDQGSVANTFNVNGSGTTIIIGDIKTDNGVTSKFGNPSIQGDSSQDQGKKLDISIPSP